MGLTRVGVAGSAGPADAGATVPGQIHFSIKEPLGTVAIILPFNYPLVLLLFGYFMVSSWRMPKFGKLKVRWLNTTMIVLLVVGYALATLQLAPEFLIGGGLLYMFVATLAHFLWTPKERPEPFFPA